MDPTKNPFAPGAGTQPPELAGRKAIVDAAVIALERVKLGRAAKSQLHLGLRGVGKTVLLNRIVELADEKGYQHVMLEAPEDRRLAEMLVPPLRQLLFRLSRLEKAKGVAKRGLGVLRAFAKTFKVKVGDVEFTVGPETGTADSGNLEADLPELLLTVSQAAHAAGSAVALFIDEVQYLSKEDLAALIVAIHKLTQKGLPLILFGAGLPQLAALAGEAKSYAERLFEYPVVGPLAEDAARDAIQAPIQREGVSINDAALSAIFQKTSGYPYFLQEWGHHAWNVANANPITGNDVEQASIEALRALDGGFFRVRLDRLTPREKEYMRAMAELGPGPHRSGEIAKVLRIGVTTAAPLRSGLIRKGMVYCPQHGDTAFTVPMFDEFMRRSMQDWRPRRSAVAARDGRGRSRPSRRATRNT
jgi:hypothetical protein